MTCGRFWQVFVVSVGMAGSAAWAQTTQPAKRALTFEKGAPWVSVESHSSDGVPREHRSLCFRQGVPWDAQKSPYLWLPNAPTFVSSFAVPRNQGATSIAQPGDFFGQLDEDKPYVLAGALATNAEIEKRAEQFGLSPEQRRLLKDSKAVILAYVSEGRRGFCCLAVSEEDARHMAEALLDAIEASRREEYERIRNELAETRKTLAEAPQQIADAEKEKADGLKAMEALKKIILVARDNKTWDFEFELQKSLRAVNIEIAGIQAKQEAIQKLRKAAKEALGLHLDQMQATQDVELAGALVRKKMVETDLKNVTDFTEASLRVGKLNELVAARKSALEAASKSLPGLERTVEQSAELLEPVAVVGPVVISPLVRPAAETLPSRSTR